MLTLWPGSYQNREEPFNFDWNAAIEVGLLKLQRETLGRLRRSAFFFNRWLYFQVNEGTNVVLQHNIVAGFERVAYRIDGEPCPGTTVDVVSIFIFGFINNRISFCISHISQKMHHKEEKNQYKSHWTGHTESTWTRSLNRHKQNMPPNVHGTHY